MTHWRTKLLLAIGLTVGFCAGYLLLQRHPWRPVTPMKLRALDQMTPFVPSAVYIYESLWLLMPVAPWLMRSRADLNRYAAGVIAITLAGFLTFWLFPTAVPRPALPAEVNGLYRALIRIDGPANAFPSLHVAFAIYHVAWCRAVVPKRAGWFIWPWGMAIVVSTLLTKQHVALDALAGAVLGWVGYRLFAPSADERLT
ncbi:MAG TPA: phosphatase PAP2 family protein [Verrucomicrobiae bacterium]|nr:phosphatase PAP2 family protein [Verrucomicrobiae bacterium]